MLYEVITILLATDGIQFAKQIPHLNPEKDILEVSLSGYNLSVYKSASGTPLFYPEASLILDFESLKPLS